MRHFRPAVAALVVIGVACALPTLAFSKSSPPPKRGYYLDTKTNVSFTLSKDLKTITGFTASCTKSGVQVSSFTLSKHLALSHRAFSYSGNVKLQYQYEKVKVKVTGAYKHGKFSGKVAEQDDVAGCVALPFKTNYYGVNPQG
jgi:hypothetical protein